MGSKNKYSKYIVPIIQKAINDNDVKIICKKSDYAHYLYGERIGCPKEYECKNLSAGCLLETIDGYYIVGELDEDSSYPIMLQVTGGGIDKDDISEVTNMYLICYDLIKIPNITINPEEKIVPATIENINKALGIELAEYQISYIFSDDYTIMYGGRYTGKTLAFIIKNLIRLDRQLSLININDIHNSVSKEFIFPYEYNLHNSNINYISNQYPRMVYDVYKKFHDAGIRTSLDKYFNDREIK